MGPTTRHLEKAELGFPWKCDFMNVEKHRDSEASLYIYFPKPLGCGPS